MNHRNHPLKTLFRTRSSTGCLILASLLLAVATLGAADGAPDSGKGKSSGSLPPLRFILDMVHHNPGEKLFETKFNEPELLRQWGYNGQVIKAFPQAALLYDAFDPALMLSGSPERAWAERYGKFMDERIAAAKTAGLPLYNFTDVLVVPEKLLLKYADEMTVGTGTITKEIIEKNRKEAIFGSLHGTGRRFSILRPMTQNVIRAQLDELFKRFPDLSGIVVRFGETYVQDTPYHVGGSPVGGGMEEHKALIRLLREEVCVKRNKMLFYRTWGWDGFLTDPKFYREVTDAIEPHPNLVFSVKHSNGDFSRSVPFNKTLGIGRHPQLVEVSCSQAGLYGKNCWPYYIGEGVIDGWGNHGDAKRGLRSLAGNPLFAGVWTWTRGDGWAGPYTPNEFWVDLNAYVINRFGQDPGRPEKEIFDEYCRQKLGLDAGQTAKFRELCLLATSATYRAQESEAYPFSSWWCRDEYLTAPKLPESLDRGLAEKIFAEKERAVADWKRVERMSRDIGLKNAGDQEFLEVSSSYGRIKMAITEQIFRIQILAALAKKTGHPDRKELSQAIHTYDLLWEEWRTLRADHKCCPSLYRDDIAQHGGPPFGTVLPGYRRMASDGASATRDKGGVESGRDH